MRYEPLTILDAPLALSLPLTMVVGYLLGSIQFAYFLGKWKRVDIYAVGTRNPGAANVFRSVGRVWGAAVFVGDALKGAAPVVLAGFLGIKGGLALLPGAAAVAGHWYPFHNTSRGGVGLATSIGASLGLYPVLGLITVAAGGAVLLVLRNTGRAATLGFILFLVLAILGEAEPLTAVGVCTLAFMVLLRSQLREKRAARAPGPK